MYKDRAADNSPLLEKPKMRKTAWLLLLSFVLAFAGCQKDAEDLDEHQKEGALNEGDSAEITPAEDGEKNKEDVMVNDNPIHHFLHPVHPVFRNWISFLRKNMVVPADRNTYHIKSGRFCRF